MSILLLLLPVSFVLSCTGLDPNSKCTGCPPMFNGKPCASTTRYVGTGSACGCFDSWAQSMYGAAPNQAFARNSRDGSTWCHDRCGQCVKMTTTGGWVEGMSPPNPPAGESIVAMLIDLCPVSGNERWCGQSKGFLECLADDDCEGHTNDYGYMVHFDLHNDQNQIFPGGMGWDNVEVVWERVDCPPQSFDLTPGRSSWENECECFENEWDPTEEIAMCSPSCDENGNGWCNDYENQCICEDGSECSGAGIVRMSLLVLLLSALVVVLF